MLSDKFRYVAMDFETTGLDVSIDDAIEIGLVEIDVYGNIVNQFKSYIKPEKDVKELKSLVAYITGIGIDEIQNAPSIFDLKDSIFEFFGENVILIGHNIEFDINMLKKYFPDVVYFDSVDTFYLAQNLVHFALSYALDVLVESLMSNTSFKKYFQLLHNGDDYDGNLIHDALYDSQNSLSLFLYEIGRIDLLFEKYPILKNILSKNTGLYSKILRYDNIVLQDDMKIILPPLKKQLPSDTSLKTDLKISLQDYKVGERYFIGNIEVSKLIKSLVSTNKQIILAFSSVAKLNIAKNILNESGIKNIGFAKGYETIDQDKFSRFLNKDDFSDDEFLFVIKYISHVLNDGSILDLNTKMDYKINYYIKNEKKFEKYPVVLSTHGGLYSILNDMNHKYRNYDVCFFDSEMRYKGYNEFQSQSTDLYSILNFLDTLSYKYTLDGEQNGIYVLERFASFFEVFMGIIFLETKKCFVGIQDMVLTINPIVGNINFYETNCLIPNFQEYKTMLKEGLLVEDFQNLWIMIDQFFSHISGIVDIKKVMYNQSEFYFTYGESMKYTNWDEFKDIFPSGVYFLSDYDKTYPKLLDFDGLVDDINMKKISNIDEVVDFSVNEIKETGEKTIYILSTIKDESKEIFDKLYASGIGDIPLLVENITGSLGKNIFKAKQQGSKIIIGGYSFFMWLISNKINIDICLEFNIIGKMSRYLLQDIQRYAKK